MLTAALSMGDNADASMFWKRLPTGVSLASRLS